MALKVEKNVPVTDWDKEKQLPKAEKETQRIVPHIPHGMMLNDLKAKGYDALMTERKAQAEIARLKHVKQAARLMLFAVENKIEEEWPGAAASARD